ncbi:MAG: efflux RND transporter permease subunit [candidate division NC10 bacterium]|nr:efflux RND transporter permease subunit [candidate division NC10 bacterium]
MRLVEICVRRPVFATMLVVSLVVLGLASFRELGLDLFPKVDLPTVTITTRLEGASPEEVESQITKRIEEVVNTISGIDELRSTTIEGQSQIFATFVLERDIDEAANDVREKVATVVGSFPPGTDAPVIEKFDPDAAPIMAVVVSGRRSAREITEIADKRIKRQLETVKDIGAITLVGDRKREIQVLVDPYRLTAHGLSIQTVKDALRRQNTEIPGGRLTWGEREEGLRTAGRVVRATDFSDLVVADVKGAPVRVRDIGQAVDGEEEARTLSRLDGKAAVSLLIRKQSGTNTVQVTDRAKTRLAEIGRLLPADIEIQVVRDQSRFIRRAITEVQEHLILGGVLASLIVLFFIRNLRTALIAALAIPASIISTFTIMRAAGFTLNNLTMLGLSISTGIVIDDAIIVLENIFRHMEEERRPPMEAAVVGAKEIALAVMATTLSLVVIFLPVAFMGGLVGRFWRSFGLTATFAIMVSLLVAFTLTPMLSSRFLRPAHAGAGHGSKAGWLYARLEAAYERLLRWCLRHRALTMIGAVSIMLSLVPLARRAKVEFITDDDMSEFEVIVETPPGSSLERSTAILGAVEANLRREVPEVERLFTTVGVRGQFTSNVTDGSIYVALKHMSLRSRSQQEIMQQVRGILTARHPELRVSVQQVGLVSGGGFRQTPFNYVIRGPEQDRLEEIAQTLIRRLRAIPGFVDTDTGQALRHPEVQVHIDRRKAADLGVSVEAIASSLRTLVGGERVTFYREAGEQYDVRLRLLEPYRRESGIIRELTVPGTNGTLVRLSNLMTLESGQSPAQIDRYSQERQITVVSNMYQKPLGEALNEATAILRGMNLPPEYTFLPIGRGKLLAEAFQNFLIAFVLSLAFIYMVLAAQFESFVHPVTIMVSMFLALPFGLLSLLVTGSTLNIYSVMGLFLLMGVRARGKPRFEAQMEADRARLRPILMTTLAIIAGMLPVAVGRGDGSASRAAMAIVVVGGQALCLLVTLLITPVIYSTFDDFRGARPFTWMAEWRLWSALRAARARVSWGLSRYANGRSPSGPPEP